MKSLVLVLSRIGAKYLGFYFSPLKETIKKSNLKILYDIYVGKMMLAVIITFFSVLVAGSIAFSMFTIEETFALVASFLLAFTSSIFVIIIFQTYPFQVLRQNRRNIETNLPFALNHMSAIASSGVSPYVMFKLMSEIKEYGEISKECGRIVRNVDMFGMAITTSIKNVASRTPSNDFKKFLISTVSIVETGGNIQKFLESSSKEAMFDYKLKRESYLQTLSMYADIYTAVLIAAPLFFVSVLSIMALVGGQVLGLDVPTALRLGIYGIIPIMNIAFLAFIHYTQPSV